jgi:4-diphosphocytidyl-2-C-methyl-D-erythritol kinase
MRLSINSPAKINLHLKIIDKDDNGYHNLDTSFQFIDLFDYMTFEKLEDEILIESNAPSIKNEDNIIYKSALLLKNISKKELGVKIKIKKNIPIGAGLGGGSSNAASTLLALNKLWELNLHPAEIINTGRNIGADVPLFLNCKNVLAKGIGDIFQEKNSDTSNYIIVDPKIFNSTKKMFSDYDKSLKDQKNLFKDDQNSFWGIFLKNNKQIEDFYKKNIKNHKIYLSGSGSAMFFKYKNEIEKQKILKIIPSNWRFFFAKPLQYSPLKEFV